jgi:hypothetical protein
MRQLDAVSGAGFRQNPSHAKARRVQTDSRDALYFPVFKHVVIPKPLHTFERHALAA